MKHIIRQFFQREAHPFIQFIKYCMAGGVATVVDVGVFYLLSWRIFPALSASDPMVPVIHWLGLDIIPVEESIRSTRYLINKVITFFFSNMTAYIVNIYWVFKPGRHSKLVEIGLFYMVSVVSFALGTAIGWGLIRFLGMTTTAAYVANAVASLAVNYVCRKYLVFKG